jgi:hypothetical protein
MTGYKEYDDFANLGLGYEGEVTDLGLGQTTVTR